MMEEINLIVTDTLNEVCLEGTASYRSVSPVAPYPWWTQMCRGALGGIGKASKKIDKKGKHRVR